MARCRGRSHQPPPRLLAVPVGRAIAEGYEGLDCAVIEGVRQAGRGIGQRE
jgi:hypothetical protein